MTQRIINIGTVANDSTGDTLRQAFSNTNNNFSELYSRIDEISPTANLAFEKANSANVLAYQTGIGANAWSNTIASAGNNYTNTYVTQVGAAGNNYMIAYTIPIHDKANLAIVLATVNGPYANDSNAAAGGVLPLTLYYTADGNVRIRLV